ncbi:MAG: class I SAM-dependent methyltransferase [Verrucomicrobiaceae bacterium]
MSFDLLAPHYRWIEALFARERLQRCRVALLDVIPEPANVLIYGEGNGRFLVELLWRFPSAQVTVVESSTVMVRLARERMTREGFVETRVSFVETDALKWQPPTEAFDLIVTCFFLDCFTEDQLQRLIPTIAGAATPDANWLVADFQIAASGWRRLRSRMIVGLLYVFFRFTTALPGHTLINPAPLLRVVGCVCAEHVEHDHGMLYSSLWRLRENASHALRIT